MTQTNIVTNKITLTSKFLILCISIRHLHEGLRNNMAECNSLSLEKKFRQNH